MSSDLMTAQEVKALGISAGTVKGYYFEQTSHLTVAAAVSRVEASAGLGPESAARQVKGIDFVPLQLEWYDMIFAAELRSRPPCSTIMDFISSQAFRRELEQVGNYDFSQTGHVVLV